MNISGKTFVVTGASGGIGGELVRSLISRDAKVIGLDIDDSMLSKLKKENDSNNLQTKCIDITNKEEVNKFAKEITRATNVDVLVNCAGIIQPFVKVNDLNFDAIERVMNVNFFGTLHMTKAFLPHLLKRPEAGIVNFSSMGGFLPVPGQSVYGASKAAVKLLTEGLFAELQYTNVQVSVVFPGATDTNITKNSGVDIPIIDANLTQKYSALPARKVSELVVRGIEKNKPQIFTGKDSKSMNILYRLNPVFATKFITKKMKSLLGGHQ